MTELSAIAREAVNKDRSCFGIRMPITECCSLCGSEDILDRMHVVGCRSCGARTQSFMGTRGEYQREVDAAANAWNNGRISVPQEQ